MNIATVLGILGAAALIVGAAVLTTDDATALWNPAGIGIVLGGTLASVLVAFPLREVLRVTRVFLIVLRNEKLLHRNRREGTGAGVPRRHPVRFDGDPGEGAADGKQPIPANRASVRHRLVPAPRTSPMFSTSASPSCWRGKQSEANMFRAMASFAPAFGMVGTLLGLVNMLGDLDQELAVLGANMAVAMMTTLYGIIAANVLFKPIAIKLEHRTQQRVETMNMVLEGVILMSQRRSAGSIRETMKTYMVDHEDEIGGKRTRKRAPTGKAVQ